MSALLLALLLAGAAPAECTATTDIPAFKEQIKKACGPRIQSVSLTGTPESAKYEITYALDLVGLEVGGAALSMSAWNFATDVRRIVGRIYPTKRFVVAIRDRSGAPVCAFVFSDGEQPDKGECRAIVLPIPKREKQ